MKTFTLIKEGDRLQEGQPQELKEYARQRGITNYIIVNLQYADNVSAAKIKENIKKTNIMSAVWQWEKIPKERYEEVKELIVNKEYSKLLKLHNDLHLSDNYFCCGTAVTSTMYNAYLIRYNSGYFDTK